MGLDDRRRVATLNSEIYSGGCARSREHFFAAGVLPSSRPLAAQNGAATFRAINVLSRNLHLTVTRRARLPASRDEMIK